MAMVFYKSECCNAKVRVNGVPDFIGSKEICTVSYVCLKCNRPCNVKESKTTTTLRERRKISAAKKRIQAFGRRLDFYDRIFQKLDELLDGITIHKDSVYFLISVSLSLMWLEIL